MATQIRRDLYADVTSRKRPGRSVHACLKTWPNPNHGSDQWWRRQAEASGMVQKLPLVHKEGGSADPEGFLMCECQAQNGDGK